MQIEVPNKAGLGVIFHKTSRFQDREILLIDQNPLPGINPYIQTVRSSNILRIVASREYKLETVCLPQALDYCG